jgi:hypothetical protein
MYTRNEIPSDTCLLYDRYQLNAISLLVERKLNIFFEIRLQHKKTFKRHIYDVVTQYAAVSSSMILLFHFHSHKSFAV